MSPLFSAKSPNLGESPQHTPRPIQQDSPATPSYNREIAAPETQKTPKTRKNLFGLLTLASGEKEATLKTSKHHFSVSTPFDWHNLKSSRRLSNSVSPSPVAIGLGVYQENPSDSMISNSDNSEASKSSSTISHDPFSVSSHAEAHFSRRSGPSLQELDGENESEILNTPIDRGQQEGHRSASIQRNDSLAPSLPSRREASTRKGSSGASKKREKDRKVQKAKQLIIDYDNDWRPANKDIFGCTLYLDEYRQLLQDAKDDSDLNPLLRDGIRYDYTLNNRGRGNKRANQFEIRMPTKIHEWLSDEIDTPIKELLSNIKRGRASCRESDCSTPFCTDKNTKTIAERLYSHRSTTVRSSVEEESDKKDPDLSYGYYEDDLNLDDMNLGGWDNGEASDHELSNEESNENKINNDKPTFNELKFPGLVVEVGWSQSRSKLQKKCEWYIEKSKGETRTVVGVDLSEIYACYPKPKTRLENRRKAIEKDLRTMALATKKKMALGIIYVWRADMDICPGKATAVLTDTKIFRDENGKATDGEALKLCLRDFIPERILKEVGLPHSLTVVIDSKELCRRFRMAVSEQIPEDRSAEEREEAKKGEQERNKRQEGEQRTAVQEGEGEESM
ncbi:hypothetical protein F4803DRAFT_52881 [Xylaria telfairii]|nr:hypothetical protein F4803DRAFT_52881 [Xylaria telfairii]